MGAAIVVESLVLLYAGLRTVGAGDALRTLVFVWLATCANLTVISVRERGAFLASRPSPALLLSVVAGLAIASLISVLGLLGMAATAPSAVLAVLAFGALCCLGINDRLKVALWARAEARAALRDRHRDPRGHPND